MRSLFLRGGERQGPHTIHTSLHSHPHTPFTHRSYLPPFTPASTIHTSCTPPSIHTHIHHSHATATTGSHHSHIPHSHVHPPFTPTYTARNLTHHSKPAGQPTLHNPIHHSQPASTNSQPHPPFTTPPTTHSSPSAPAARLGYGLLCLVHPDGPRGWHLRPSRPDDPNDHHRRM